MKVILIFLLSIISVLIAPQQPPIVAEGNTPQLIAKQFAFTEGPASDKEGTVYFTDQPNNEIWKYSEDGKLSLFMKEAGRSNGMYFNSKNKLIACADENSEIWSIERSGKVKILLGHFEGKRLNGPNDVWVSPTDDLYFTDPYYQRSYWTRTKPEINDQRVYYLAKGRKKPSIAADELTKPNGIVGTPDGRYLYVADIGANKTYRYQINTEGKLTNKTLFAEQGSDGMTLDNQGNVYLTGKGISVYNPQGERIKHISIPSEWTSNVCFFGKERNLLFITAGESIYFLPMLVKGAGW